MALTPERRAAVEAELQWIRERLLALADVLESDVTTKTSYSFPGKAALIAAAHVEYTRNALQVAERVEEMESQLQALKNDIRLDRLDSA